MCQFIKNRNGKQMGSKDEGRGQGREYLNGLLKLKDDREEYVLGSQERRVREGGGRSVNVTKEN